MSTHRDLRRPDGDASRAPAAGPEAAPAGRRVRLVASRERAAACTERLRLATDALAAADLLLGMNFSIGACGPQAPAPEGER